MEAYEYLSFVFLYHLFVQGLVFLFEFEDDTLSPLVPASHVYKAIENLVLLGYGDDESVAIDKAVAQDIAAKAHVVCPYSHATKGNIKVIY